MEHLLLIDTTQIQEYIFKSNRLRENIGASYLAAQATGPWILECLADTVGEHNVLDAAAERLDPGRHYEEGLNAEVIYTGGGNGMIVFRKAEQMAEFIKHYSRCLLLQAPGLQVFTADLAFDWEETDQEKRMYKHVSRLFDEVAAVAKRKRLPNNPLLGLGVSAACRSTGLPAVAMAPMVQEDPDSVYPVSAEILAKLKAAEPRGEKEASLADEQLHERLGLDRQGLYLYPSDFDDMGRSLGEQSYIAVVHADGDRIGQHIKEIGADPQLNNRDYISARRDFSDELKRVGRAALLATVHPLLRQLGQDSREGNKLIHFNAFGQELGRITLAANKNGSNYYLPFRPLVMAGDDLTFVCDGRLGLALTSDYLAHFQREFEDQFTASAGVSIVKVHYPFARAYGLAEELSTSAKDYGRDNKDQLQGGCLDWYFTAGGLHAGLEEMRARDYAAADGSLTLRPVALESQRSSALKRRTWPTVRAGIDAFQDAQRNGHEAPQWSNRRNKVKALRDALRDGQMATEQFMVGTGIKQLPRVVEETDFFRSDGWYQGQCGYFDALELADLFMPVRPPGEDT